MPLRSIIVALVGAAGLTACPGNGSSSRASGGAGFQDAFEEILDYQCECFAADAGLTQEQCRQMTNDATGLPQDLGACIDEVLTMHPDAQAPLDCAVNAQYDYAECLSAQGCPANFTCGDGQSVPENWVCDGEPDCADGSDEMQSCPGDHTCGDGEVVPAAWICDGDLDCDDGSDEAGACESTCDTRLDSAIDACPPFPEAFDQAVSEQCFEDMGEPGEEPPPGAGKSPDGSTRSRLMSNPALLTAQNLAMR